MDELGRRMAAACGGHTLAMGRAVGWGLIVLLVYMMGTHPAALVGLLDQALAVLQRAGQELSSLVGKL